jgi:arylsulfatase A-like enzyme
MGGGARRIAPRRIQLLAAATLALAVAGCQTLVTHEGGSGTYGYNAVQSSANAGYQAVQKTSSAIPDPYDGTWVGKAQVNGGAGEATYARGVLGTFSAGWEGYYGAAFYFPSGTFAKQTGDVEIMGWEDGSGGDGGIRISSSDHRARLMTGQSQTIGRSFELQEGCWNWVAVRQRFGTPPENDVFLNGHRIFTSNASNNFGNPAGSVRFGLVSVDPAQSSPLDIYVDDAYVSPDELVAPLTTACKPNILIFLTDDQRLKASGNTGTTMDVMPKTKQWFQTGGTLNGQPFEGGTFYPNAVDTTPLCCPSRGSILSGLYAHNHGIMWNPQAKVDFDRTGYDTSATLQAHLRERGYRTGIFGKYFNGWGNYFDATGKLVAGPPGPDPPEWDEWSIYEQGPLHSGFEVNEQGTQKFVYQYESNYVGDRADDFLQRNQSQPWFLYVAPWIPHEFYSPEPKYAKASVPGLEKNAAYFEPDRLDKPAGVQRTWQDADTIELQYRNHLRMLKSYDDLVDRVMTKLHSLGEDENTLAFFLSDNGYMWGQHGLKDKVQPYPESIQVPFFARWPGYIAGNQTDNRFVANIDLPATALDAVHAGQGAPAVDGRSLLAQGRKRKLDFTEVAGVTTSGSCSGGLWAAIKSATFQYIAYYKGTLTQDNDPLTKDLCLTNLSESPYFREYYDITSGADPLELTNLLGDGSSENDPPTAQLDELVNRYRSCGNSSGEQPCQWADEIVDFLLPDTKITTRDSEDVTTPSTSSGDTRPTFAFTSTEPNSTFDCTLDGLPCNDSNASPSKFTPSSSLAPGNHTLSVKAVSPDGYGDATPATFTWEVKPSDPETEITSKPAKMSTSTTASFSFRTASSHSPSSFECQLDTGSFLSCPSGTQSYAVGNGAHTFKVRSIFGATPDPTPAQYSWTVDATAPETQITAGPTEGSTSTKSKVTLSFRTPAGGEFAGRFECKLEKDGVSGQYQPCASLGSPTQPACTTAALPCSKTFTGLVKGGTYKFSVRAVDSAGNTDSTPATRQWTVGSIQTFDDQPDTTWPQVTQGNSVRAIVPPASAPLPDRGWFVGGDFTEVAGQAHTDLVHINSNKTLDSSWTPSTNGAVYAMEESPSGDTLYVGGSFTCVNDTSADCANGTPRNNLAAFQTDPSQPGYGTPTDWNPGADGPVYALRYPNSVSSDTAANTIYVGGAFIHIGQAARNKVAEIETASPGNPTSWNPQVSGVTGSAVYALTATRRDVYVGGQFASVGSLQRKNLAEIDRLSGQVTGWNPNPDAGIIRSLAVTPAKEEALPTIYVGGQFDNIGSPRVPRKNAAQINLSDGGSTTDWDPSVTLGMQQATVFSMRPLLPVCTTTDFRGCNVFVGGSFSDVGGLPRSWIAETDASTGVLGDWNPAQTRGIWAISQDRNAGVLGIGGPVPDTRNLLSFYNAL